MNGYHRTAPGAAGFGIIDRVALLALVHRGGRSPLTARLVPGTLGVAGLLVLAVAAEVAVAMLG